MSGDEKQITQTWFHYSEEPRTDNMVFRVPVEHMTKIEALHFAQGDEWLETGIPTSLGRKYKHKYILANLESLNICEISMKTFQQLDKPYSPQPNEERGTVFNWKQLEDAGYDGCYIHHWDIFRNFESPFRSWPSWAHAFDIDTIVIWRGALLKEIDNDFAEKEPKWAIEYENSKNIKT